MEEVALFAMEDGKGRVGAQFLPLINTDDMDQNQKTDREKLKGGVYAQI